MSEQDASEDENPEILVEELGDFYIGKGAKEGTTKATTLRGSRTRKAAIKVQLSQSDIDAAYKWRKTPYTKTKTKQKNICNFVPGLTACAKDITDEVSAFGKMIDADMVDEIVRYTNIFIIRLRTGKKYLRERDCSETSKSEILALFGASVLIGIKHGHHTNVKELWNRDGTGIIALRALMSYNRFLFLLRCLRFDDSSTRPARKATDKLAAIRSILDQFVNNCKKNYTVGAFITIDEMLHPFRGRCSFVQYMPSKPAKYGLKVLACCDSKTFYTSNLEVYCGQQMDGPYRVSNSPAEVVKRLVQPLENKNRNLTTDNWYTSYSLTNYLLSKKFTFIGTMRKNKREIPPEFLPNKFRETGSSIFGFQKDMTIVSYVPRAKKAVILLSSMHDTDDIDSNTNKPNIILDYNATKGAVDTVDKMCAAYSVSRITKRWPLALFFVLVNIAGINSQILYYTKHANVDQVRRRIFLKNLCMGLMKEHLILRSTIYTLPKDLFTYLQRYRLEENETEPSTGSKRGRCRLCKNNNTTVKCGKCRRFICKKHSQSTVTCVTCVDNAEEDASSDCN